MSATQLGSNLVILSSRNSKTDGQPFRRRAVRPGPDGRATVYLLASDEYSVIIRNEAGRTELLWNDLPTAAIPAEPTDGTLSIRWATICKVLTRFASESGEAVQGVVVSYVDNNGKYFRAMARSDERGEAIFAPSRWLQY